MARVRKTQTPDYRLSKAADAAAELLDDLKKRLSHRGVEDLLRGALAERYASGDDYLWVRDVYDGEAIFDHDQKTWLISFAIVGTDVKLGDERVEVVQIWDWVPVDKAKERKRPRYVKDDEAEVTEKSEDWSWADNEDLSPSFNDVAKRNLERLAAKYDREVA